MLKTISETKYGVNQQQTRGRFGWRVGGMRLGGRYYVIYFERNSKADEVTIAEYDGPDAEHFARLTAARLNGQL